MSPRLAALLAATTLTQSEDNPSARIKKETETAVQNLLDEVKCTLDDKEALADDPATWVKTWDVLFAAFRDATERATKLGVQTSLLDAVKKEIEAGEETAARWRKMGEAGLCTVKEPPPVVRVDTLGKVKEKRRRVPITQTKGEQDRPKVAVKEVVKVLHDPACEHCVEHRNICRGSLNRSCDACIGLHHKCEKSRGRRIRNAVGGKGKGKAPVEYVPREKRRRVDESIVIELTDSDEEEEAQKPEPKHKPEPVMKLAPTGVISAMSLSSKASPGLSMQSDGHKTRLEEVRTRFRLAQVQYERAAEDLKRATEELDKVLEEVAP